MGYFEEKVKEKAGELSKSTIHPVYSENSNISAEKRIKADEVLTRNDLTRDQKLFVLSQLYKNELNSQFPQLHYAFLGWKDSHLKELRTKEVIDCLEDFKM